jgi:hypothetical protein
MQRSLSCFIVLSLIAWEGLARATTDVRFIIPKSPRIISPYIYGFGTYMHEDREAEGVLLP